MTAHFHRRRRTLLRRIWAASWLALALLLAIGPLAAGAPTAVNAAALHQAAINAQLLQDLQGSSRPQSFLVILKDQVQPAQLLAAAAAGRIDAQDPALARRQILYQTLTQQAAQTQAPLRAWLADRGIPFRPFYLVNMIEVQGDLALAQALAARPEVDRLARNPVTSLPVEPPSTAAAAAAAAVLPWGLHYTKADQVWALGDRGAGIVVASQDTGVEWDHPALKAAYRGWNAGASTASHPYNWFDVFGADGRPASCSPDPQVPCDDIGSTHGTHTTGTMVGDATAMGNTVLGMAPDAKWIACRNMRQGVGTPASYTACFQFFLAPYPQGGSAFTDGKPELAPDIVNNSWGCPPSEGCDADSLRQVVENVRAAGIFVAASAGNSGPGCHTVQDPIAIYDASFTVGAHDSGGTIASFSSRGSVTVDGSGRRKPDLAAPGVDVRSAGRNGSVNSILSGTSMASPHVAGAVALLWSAVPALKHQIDLTEQVLLKSTQPVDDSECDSAGATSPNNTYGFGRLDVLAAVQLATHATTMNLLIDETESKSITATVASLQDLRTGYSYSGEVTAENSAQWARVYAGTYQIAVTDTTGAVWNSPVDLVIGNPVRTTISLTTTISPSDVAHITAQLTIGSPEKSYYQWLPIVPKH